MRIGKTSARFAATAALGLSGAALGAPEFIVTPLQPPPEAVGFRPRIQLDAAVVLGREVKDIVGGELEGQAGQITVSESSPGGSFVEGRLGFDWRVCRRAIVGHLFSDFEGVIAPEGGFCELISFANIDSPSPSPGQPIRPRITLTEPAEVRVSWEASATSSGSMSQRVVGLALTDPDAPPPANLLVVVEHQGHIGEPDWADAGEVTLTLDAGEYDLHASVSHQGTIASPNSAFFGDAMTGHTALRFRIEIVGAGCVADLTGDGLVDVEDLNAVLGAWDAPDAAGDADCSGHVDVDDLNAVLASWGGACS